MRIWIGLLIATLVMVAGPAYGSMIVISGVTFLPSAPSSVVFGQLASDTTMYAFAEQQGVILPSQVYTGIDQPGTYICCNGFAGGYLPEGADVNSYLVHEEPVTDSPDSYYRVFEGSITFSPGEYVVGIIAGYRNLLNTDALFGSPTTVYPSGDNYAALENFDTITLSADLRTVTFMLYTSDDHMDNFRILTETPEPVDFLLIGSGLMALGLLRRRFTRPART